MEGQDSQRKWRRNGVYTFFFPNLYINLVLNLLSLIVIEIMLMFLLGNDEPLRMECFGSLQTK
jgi:hypothetical protein